MRALAISVVGIVTLATAAHARADVRDAAAAEELFREGRAHMESGDLRVACPKFAESLRLDFAAGTLLNLAACEEKQGRLASAWEHFARLVEVLPASDDRRPFASQRLSELEHRVPKLTVTLSRSAVAGLRVTRDDIELRAASLGVALPVDPGEHTIAVSAPGYAENRYRVSVTQGEQRALAVEPGIPIDESATRHRTHVGGYIVGGAGVVALGVGAYFGVRALSSRASSDAGCVNGICNDASHVQAYDDAKSYAHIADAALGVGVVALAVGTYMVLTSQDAPPPKPKSVGALVTATGIGLRW